MFTHTERQNRRDTFANSRDGKVRRKDRRDAIARKSAFLVDGLTVRNAD